MNGSQWIISKSKARWSNRTGRLRRRWRSRFWKYPQIKYRGNDNTGVKKARTSGSRRPEQSHQFESKSVGPAVTCVLAYVDVSAIESDTDSL